MNIMSYIIIINIIRLV